MIREGFKSSLASMMFWLGCLLGCIVGGAAGIFGLALARSAARASMDERELNTHLN